MKHLILTITAGILGGMAAMAAPGEALAHSVCANGKAVTFTRNVNLTVNDKVMCKAKKGAHATARKIGASRVSCYVEYWGKCKEGDHGWVRLNAIRRGL